MKTLLYSLALGTLVAIALPVSAQELYYANIGDIHNNSVILNYASPSESERFLCSTTSFECSKTNKNILPDEARAQNIQLSAHGEHAVKIENSTAVTVYEVTEDDLDEITSFSVTEPILSTRFSRDGSTLILIQDTAFRTYNIETGAFNYITYNTPAFNQFLASPSGDYVTYWSNRTLGIHNLQTGQSATIPAPSQVYLEISEDGNWGTYRERTDAGTTLRLVNLAAFPQVTTSQAFTTNREIDDYIFFENELYFTTNGHNDSPYEWSLMRLNPQDLSLEEVGSGVAYSNYMKTTDNALLYYKHDGSILNVYAITKENKDGTRLEAHSPNTIDRDITRTQVEFGDVPGVLLEPEGTDKSDNLPLVVWLHGGPMRQTSLKYHPYLSYGVYDELLEKIATEARVLKLDYPGSWGYGNAYQEILQGGIGVEDISGIETAVNSFQDQYATEKLHMMGNSYGAYLALKFAVENPEVTQTAISIAGVTDWRSLTQQIPSSVFTPRFGGVPTFSNEHLYAQADILHKLPVLENNTKLLVVYGENDTTVPVWQSKYFIPTTRAYDIETDTLIFEDEAHTISKRDNLDDLCKAVGSTLNMNLVCGI